MPKKTLTDAAIQRIKTPSSGQVEYFDNGYPGLALRVSHGGGRSFVHMYRFNGRLRRRTLGQYPGTSLADAHEAWRQDRENLGKGRDPVQVAEDEKRSNEAEAVRKKANTYQSAVEDYHARYQVGEKGNATADETKRVLLKEGAGWLSIPVSAITARDVRRLLEKIRDGGDGTRPRPYLANRTHAYLRRFFAWCAEPGIEILERSPMEGLKKPWDGEETRDKVFDDDELKALWNGADDIGLYGGAFLCVLLLTGKRKGALAAMRRDEIDADGVWTPPQDARRRRRTKRTHTIPLPAKAREIIDALPTEGNNPYVFVGGREGKHLDPGTPLQVKIQKVSGVADFYFHACRHTVETRMAEIHIAPHVRDLVLDHAMQRGAGSGYDHYQYITEMRHALDAWAAKIERIIRPSGDDNVVTLPSSYNRRQIPVS